MENSSRKFTVSAMRNYFLRGGFAIDAIRIFKYDILPLLVLYALYQFFQGKTSKTDLILFISMSYGVGVGLTAGYHRMETHQAFKAHPAVRFILLALGSMNLSGPPSYWVSTHLTHHAFADKDGDPHSPIHGFWHSHYKWLYTMDFTHIRDPYMKRFEGDRMLAFFDKTSLLWVLIGAVVPYAIDGWNGVLWGFAVRTFLNTHVTFLINSWGHSYGSRNFNTKDKSRNNFWLGLISAGEGWHNNHHAFPNSARFGLKWHEIDIGWYIVWLLEKLGLVTQVNRASKELIEIKQIPIPRQDAA